MLTLFIIAVVVLVIVVYRNRQPTSHVVPLLRRATLIYQDNPSQRYVFENQEYRIRAKPDFIYQLAPGLQATVEYKGRNGKVKEWDIPEVIAQVVAVRPQYPDVKKAIIYTKGGHYRILDLDLPVNQIADKIQTEIQDARIIQSGRVPRFKPSKFKCRSCSLRLECSQSLA